MNGLVFIDGNDIYQEYGVYITSGGWNELVTMPPLKSVENNDWQEEDGIEADLSAPVLDTRDLSVTFAITGRDIDDFIGLIDLLSDGAYHEFDCACIGRKYTLRLTGNTKMEYAQKLGLFTLKLADDFPLADYTYQAPSTSFPEFEDYLLDDVPFTNYGVRILSGSLSPIVAYPDVKTNLLRNISTESGAIYDPKNVTYKTKDVTLNCLLRAKTLEEMWRNYDALLYDMVRPEERELTVDALYQDFPCYYKECSVSEFRFEGKLWMKFTLTFCLTRDLRLSGVQYVLATEDDTVVDTEDGIYYVDMRNAQLADGTVAGKL